MEYEAKRPVLLPVTDFLDLDLHLMDTRPGVAPDVFVADLVRRWLAAERERPALRSSGAALRGVQWKAMFLPDGTNLRTGHGDKVAFAKVIGDHIVTSDGANVSPSQFANRGASGRHAWRFVWLRFPGEDHWFRADECRASLRQQSPKRSRMVARSVGIDPEPRPGRSR